MTSWRAISLDSEFETSTHTESLPPDGKLADDNGVPVNSGDVTGHQVQQDYRPATRRSLLQIRPEEVSRELLGALDGMVDSLALQSSAEMSAIQARAAEFSTEYFLSLTQFLESRMGHWISVSILREFGNAIPIFLKCTAIQLGMGISIHKPKELQQWKTGIHLVRSLSKTFFEHPELGVSEEDAKTTFSECKNLLKKFY